MLPGGAVTGRLTITKLLGRRKGLRRNGVALLAVAPAKGR